MDADITVPKLIQVWTVFVAWRTSNVTVITTYVMARSVNAHRVSKELGTDAVCERDNFFPLFV